MAHEVFISYSSKDKEMSNAVCAVLESRKFRCWIAPRDVPPGMPYGEALLSAIHDSKVLVLVFSAFSNESSQVMREVERAVSAGIPILPFRIENVLPTKAMEYFISSHHWLDAMTPPVEAHLIRLADSVGALVSRLSANPVAAERARRRSGQVFSDLPIAPQMVVLPSGSFMMGSPDDDAHGCDEERPQHKVTIAYQLAMGRYPVTFEEWDACVADGGIDHQPEDEGWGRGKRPVINVNWHDAQAYATWLNQKLAVDPTDPTRYRLPSEAEWEYACRAGTTGNFSTPIGQLSDNDATYDAKNFIDGILSPKAGKEHDKTTPVGIYAPNPWGLYDMHGNVMEWVQDDYEDSYRGAPADGTARKTGAADLVLRGGCWCDGAWCARAVSRKSDWCGRRCWSVGFRLARTVP